MKTYKILFVSLSFFGIVFSGLAQERYQLTASDVRFFSETVVENIEAHTGKTQGVIDFGANKFAFKIPNESFTFEKSLMQEHFNENYMESEKYPHSIFTGAIEGDFDLKKDGEYKIKATGDLKIHGVTKNRTLEALIKVKNGAISIDSKFKVVVADHKIKIPSVVFMNIAEIIEVQIKGDLVKL